MASSHPQIPNEAPPSYEAAIFDAEPTQGIHRVSTDGPAARTERNGIPPDRRRSMEDEMRELPPGWTRSFDAQSQHQFFVDTTKNPPRSIWVHPYDDEEFLSTLSPEERKKHTRMHSTMTMDDLAAEDSDTEEHPLPPRPTKGKVAATPVEPTGIHKFSRKLKDKITGQTHEERERSRAQRAEQERQAYAQHMRMRQAMVRAMETGQPQIIGKDRQGRDVYIEPPHGGFAPRGAYGAYNPYGGVGFPGQNNMRYMRPAQPYGRPYGYGYGGGAGLGMPLAAGLLGGSLLGAAMF
jgi:hypothetical protein